jgi:hypothetical protein
MIEQTLFELIEGGGCLLSDLLEANPNQDGAGNGVALDTRQGLSSI